MARIVKVGQWTFRRRALPLLLATGVFVAALAPRPARADDPTTADCLGANEEALKADNEHRLRAERSQLLVCAAANCPMDIRKECARRVDEVNAAIPTVIFEVKDPSGSDLGAVRVTMDGQVLAQRLEGTALSIDPGEHAFVFEVAGQPALKKTFIIREAEKDRRLVVVVGEASPAAPPVPVPLVPASPLVETPPAPAAGVTESTGSRASTWNGRKTIAIVIGGAGVAGVAVGGIFGGVAASKWSSAKGQSCPHCTESQFQQASSDQSSASSAATVSTVAFIAGGALLATGTVLWFTAPSGHEAPPSPTAWRFIPSFGPGGGGLSIEGSF